jgi:hypothetical protein
VNLGTLLCPLGGTNHFLKYCVSIAKMKDGQCPKCVSVTNDPILLVPVTRVGMVSLCTVLMFIQTQFGASSQTEPAAKFPNVEFRLFCWRSLTLKSKTRISPAPLDRFHIHRMEFLVAVQVYLLQLIKWQGRYKVKGARPREKNENLFLSTPVSICHKK